MPIQGVEVTVMKRSAFLQGDRKGKRLLPSLKHTSQIQVCKPSKPPPDSSGDSCGGGGGAGLRIKGLCAGRADPPAGELVEAHLRPPHRPHHVPRLLQRHVEAQAA